MVSLPQSSSKKTMENVNQNIEQEIAHPAGDSTLILTDMFTRKKIFHLTTNSILLGWSIFLFLYHVIMGIIWFVRGYAAYGLSDVLMFLLNILTLSMAVCGVLGVVHGTM